MLRKLKAFQIKSGDGLDGETVVEAAPIRGLMGAPLDHSMRPPKVDVVLLKLSGTRPQTPLVMGSKNTVSYTRNDWLYGDTELEVWRP